MITNPCTIIPRLLGIFTFIVLQLSSFLRSSVVSFLELIWSCRSSQQKIMHVKKALAGWPSKMTVLICTKKLCIKSRCAETDKRQLMFLLPFFYSILGRKSNIMSHVASSVLALSAAGPLCTTGETSWKWRASDKYDSNNRYTCPQEVDSHEL